MKYNKFIRFWAKMRVPAIALTLIPIVSMAQQDSSDMLFVPGEVIVKWKARGIATSAGILRATDASNIGLQSTPSNTTSGGEHVYKLSTLNLNFPMEGPAAASPTPAEASASQADAFQSVLTAVEQLNAHDEVEYAQPNWIFRHTSTPNDPRYGEQWHYFKNGNAANQSLGGIGLPAVWDAVTGNTNVVVAVIDTGILPNHPDIVRSPNHLTGYDMISNVFMANDGGGRDADPTDPGNANVLNECCRISGYNPILCPRDISAPRNNNWHGTHVAGTVGIGNTNNGVGVAGVNWNTRVLPVRVLGKCGGNNVDISDAIRWAAGLPVQGVPNNANPADIINLSLGGNQPCINAPMTQNAINDAVAAGATVVVAAGNKALNVNNFQPASCNNVIAVAASDARGHLVNRYSNFGARIDIMAPGGDLNRDDNGDGRVDGVLSMVNGGYTMYNGTSMAAPHVSGVAALMLVADPTLTPVQIEQRIKDNAIPRTAAQCPNACGAGLLNASLFQALYDFEALNVAPINGQDNWVVMGNVNIDNAQVKNQSSPYGKALEINSLGGNKQLYVSRVNNANWAFPNLGSSSLARLEFDLKGNYWSANFHLAYDANNDGKISSDEKGFGLGTTDRLDKVRLFGADGTQVTEHAFSTTAQWNRYRIDLDLKANNGRGSATVYVLDSNGTTWNNIIAGVDMGFDPNASDKTNPSKLNGMFFYQDADSSRLDNIAISIIPTATYDFEALNVAPINGQDNWVVMGNVNIDNAQVKNQSPPSGKALEINSLGGNKQLYVSRVNNANWAFPTLSTSFKRVEFDLKGNYWSANFHLAYDANNDGKISSDEKGFGLGTTDRLDKVRLFGADGTQVTEHAFSTTAQWNRYRIDLDLKANNGRGSATVYVLDSNGTTWNNIIAGVDMGFDPNASDKTNPSKLNGMFFYQDADNSRLDNITIASW